MDYAIPVTLEFSAYIARFLRGFCGPGLTGFCRQTAKGAPVLSLLFEGVLGTCFALFN
jgi:glutamine amidotransferase-like uncharacterized protein